MPGRKGRGEGKKVAAAATSTGSTAFTARRVEPGLSGRKKFATVVNQPGVYGFEGISARVCVYAK